MNERKKIVFLDAYTNNPGDLDFGSIAHLGDLTVYPRSMEDEILQKAGDAEILIVNKFPIHETLLEKLPMLKYIAVAATGYNNIDIEAVKNRQIKVSNAVAYSTNSVAQHVFAMLLNILQRVDYYNQEVKKGTWAKCDDFCFYHHTIYELANKKFGIIGYGKIGQRVGEIARAFGMTVLVHSRTIPQIKPEGVEFVDAAYLFANADVLSLHCPLTPETSEIIQRNNLKKMKPNLILINTGRGGLINESDLFYALDHQIIRGAALDVLTIEPPMMHHALIQHPSCYVTPHLAWTSIEARQRLLEITAENIQSYLNGTWINNVYECV